MKSSAQQDHDRHICYRQNFRTFFRHRFYPFFHYVVGACSMLARWCTLHLSENPRHVRRQFDR